MAINRALIAKQLVPGINALFGDSYNAVPKTWDRIFQSLSSDRAYEEDVKLGAPGLAADKAEGSSVSYEQWGEEYTVRYQHTTVAKGFIEFAPQRFSDSSPGAVWLGPGLPRPISTASVSA